MTVVDQEVVGEGDLPRIDYPNVPLGIFLEKVFQENLDKLGDAKWMTDVSTGKSMNYSEMIKAMRSVASGLRKRGFQAGDNVIVIASNFIESPLMMLGAQRAGGFQACFDPLNLPTDVIELRMKELKTKFVLTDLSRSSWTVEFTKKFEFIKEVFVAGDVPVPGCTPFDQLLQDIGDECPENLDEIDMDSTCWMPFTSGTTGLPKGIIRTHQVVIVSLLRWKHLANKKGFKYLLCYRMNGMAGMTVSTGFSLAHAELYCLSDFSEINFLTAIDRVKPIAISLEPFHLYWICRNQHLDKYDLASVRKITIMGSTVNANYEREVFNKFPNLLFLENVYGMSEIGTVSQTPSALPDTWEKLNKLETIAKRVFGSVGKVITGCKLKVIDVNSGGKLGPNQIGEICAQSPYMFKEYFNNPEETTNVIRNGWAHTGDQGYYDENENIFIVGRFKELFKYRNIHVQPTNIERHMITHPAIADVAVVGLPDELDGHRPLAFVVLSPDSQGVKADELSNYTNERVTEMEKLRGGIRFINEIPRNTGQDRPSRINKKTLKRKILKSKCSNNINRESKVILSSVLSLLFYHVDMSCTVLLWHKRGQFI